MQSLAITGTDGKSTTCFCLYHILKTAGYKVGILSTVYLDIGDGIQDNHSKLTSLSHRDFWKLVQQAEKNGITHMVVEVSSHALYQYRIWPLKFMGVGFTNLSREHLDFHWTMEHYARTKAKLFGNVVAKETKETKGEKGIRETKEPKETRKEELGSVGVVAKDFAYRSILDHYSKVDHLVTFGYDADCDIFVSDIQQTPCLAFQLHYAGQILNIQTKILGAFNAENMMIATVLAHHIWCSLEHIIVGLESFPGLPGRQEMVLTKQWVSVMIDFALTPDAFQTLYTAVRGMGYRHMIAVFGATGTRDQGKRPEMGRIATELCDFVVITEDENYSEDGMKIMKAIEGWIQDKSPGKHILIQDRTEAIRHAIALAQPGDIVIVTGMANFSSRGMNEGSIPRNEKEVVEEGLREWGYHLI